ncbi:MAG: TldD/PmbA family protein, partial [Dehalococcoidales bacterium]|nr:TldD/PmbA family protein [Dehalococcoidales bacterium]
MLPDIEAAAQQLADAIKGRNADYIEAHLEQVHASQISYRGKELESIGRSTSIGGNIRALVRGGWGFTSFNSLDDLSGRIELAIKQARLAGTGESRLTPVAPVVDTVPTGIDSNPVDIPLKQKRQLLDEYNEIIWRTPNLQTSVIGYSDSIKKSIFVSSPGSYIEQERADVIFRLTAVATSGNEVQQANLSLGSRGDFGTIRHLHEDVARTAQCAVELLSAPQIKGGEYTVILDPVLAGVFVHEAFGHLSEADFVYENEKLRRIMTLGKKFGGKKLNIVDSAAEPGLRGSYKYDDEGVPASKTYLIREGKLVGRLHSRETAARMNESPSGNARAVSYRYPPIVRMTNTYIEPGSVSFDDMIADIKEGIYAKNWYGGTTSMEMFT